MSNSLERRFRVDKLYEVIQRCNEGGSGAKEHELINQGSEVFGVRPDKVREYIKELIEKGKVKHEGSLLWVNNEYSEQLSLF